VVVEEDLRAEGLLETGYDWYVKRVAVSAQATADREFLGIFDDWRSRVEAYHAASTPEAPRAAEKQTGESPSLEARGESPPAVDRRHLRLLLETHFSDDELRALCFDLNVDYESLPGATKPARVIGMIGYFERMRRTEEFLRAVKELRPNEAL